MTEKWALTKGQQRMVLALVQQRQEVTTRANEALVEIGEGLQEATKLVAATLGLKPDEVEFADGETPGEVVMRRKEAAAE